MVGSWEIGEGPHDNAKEAGASIMCVLSLLVTFLLLRKYHDHGNMVEETVA